MEEYQSFRRRTMTELTREYPDKSYREKMKMVGERWKQTKITQLVRMDNRELLEDPIDEQYIRRLKYTIIDVGVEDFLDIEVTDPEPKNLLLAIISRIFRNSPICSLAIPLFRKFLTYKEFYRKKIYDLDILDLCCLHFRYDFAIHIFEAIPPRWRQEFILENKERLPSLMNVFLYNVFDDEFRPDVIEVLKQLLIGGLDPNLELSSPLSDARPPYEDSLTKIIRDEGLSFEAVKPLVRYVGILDDDYRRRLRESEYVRRLEVVLLEESMSRRLVGDTVFSVLLQNSRNQKTRAFVSGILRSGVVYTNTILHPYKYANMEGVKTYLSISLLTGSLRHMDELSSLLFEDTPSYMFYISDLSQKTTIGSSVNPMSMAFKNIKTCWNGFLRTSPDFAPVLSKILTGGFCVPRESLFWKIHMQPDFAKYVREEIIRNYFQRKSKPVFENLLEACENRDLDPLKTCLSSLVLYPPVLRRILENPEEGLGVMRNQAYVLRQFHAYRKEVYEQITGLCRSNYPGEAYVNETFLLDGEPVEGSGKLIFRTEDNYAFEPRDWPFLLKKRNNPYTRRELTDGERTRLQTLREIVNRYWVVLSREEIPYADFLEQEERSLRDVYVSKIDEYLDSIDMVNYGTRLRDHVGKLENPEVLRNFYRFLFQNPGLCSFGPDTDSTFADWCCSFSQSSIDPGDLEEIGVYYGFRIRNPSFSGFGSNPSSTSESNLVNVLGHIYNVLESTHEYGRKDRFIGRVLSVYYLLDNYLRPL